MGKVARKEYVREIKVTRLRPVSDKSTTRRDLRPARSRGCARSFHLRSASMERRVFILRFHPRDFSSTPWPRAADPPLSILAPLAGEAARFVPLAHLAMAFLSLVPLSAKSKARRREGEKPARARFGSAFLALAREHHRPWISGTVVSRRTKSWSLGKALGSSRDRNSIGILSSSRTRARSIYRG